MFQPVIFRAPADGRYREVEMSALACRGIWNSQAAGDHVRVLEAISNSQRFSDLLSSARKMDSQ